MEGSELILMDWQRLPLIAECLWGINFIINGMGYVNKISGPWEGCHTPTKYLETVSWPFLSFNPCHLCPISTQQLSASSCGIYICIVLWMMTPENHSANTEHQEPCQMIWDHVVHKTSSALQILITRKCSVFWLWQEIVLVARTKHITSPFPWAVQERRNYFPLRMCIVFFQMHYLRSLHRGLFRCLCSTFFSIKINIFLHVSP